MSLLNIPQSLRLAEVPTEDASVKQPIFTVPGLKLGQAANLLLGFKPGWVATDVSTAPFFFPDSEPLPTSDATISPASPASWGFPRITLHDDRNSMLSAVFPYDVQPLTGDSSTFCVPSGPLMSEDLDGARMLSQLSEYLGVDLTAGDSYMLVELVRTSGTASRTYVAGSGGDAADHLTADALAALSALTGVQAGSDPAGRLTAQSAPAFLKSFQAVGTHYVSQVTAGDRIFQIFAYQAAAFAELTAAFNKSAAGKNYVEGLSAIPFQYYTTPRSSGTGIELGYVSGLGAVRIASADPAFAASVKGGAWNDAERAGGNSIFVAYHTGTTVDLAGFQAVVPIGFELTPLGNLIPVDKCAAGRRYWDRLLKGSLLQKYGQLVRVAFPAEQPYHWQSLLPNSGAWLSTIATPTVNVYDGHVSLGGIELTNRPVVKSFNSWSMVLEAGATAPVEIPGDAVSLSSYLIDTSGPDGPPTIELASQTAYQAILLACGRMNGALIVCYSGGSEHKTVMDGVLLKTGAAAGSTGRCQVAVSGDLFGQRDSAWLQAQESNLNFSIVTCQTLLYSRGSLAADGQALARDCLVWLTDIIPDSDSTATTLAAIRLRAAYLAHVAGRLDVEGVTVPYLTYSNYKDYIAAMAAAASTLNRTIDQYQTQISIQRNAELTAKTAAQINANIKTSGALLKNYIDAVATNQGDIAANYQNIITTKQRELQSALASFKDLAKAVSEQKDAVEDAKLDFQKAMVDYETTEIIKAVITISTAFVTVGLTIATPSSTFSALKDLGETAQKIQKLITVLDAIMAMEKAIEGTVRNMNAVSQTLDALKNSKLDMPSSLEWSEMSINFDASLASVPSEVASARAKFQAAFHILVLRAQAMLSAQSRIAQLNVDIVLNKAQKKINDDQQQRLAKLTAALNLGDTSKAPDLSEVDLLGLTGHVQSQLNQVLASLAQALILQDSAVQFELLATPTPIPRFDLGSLEIVMASQQANIISAKEAFNPPPFKVNDPIQVTIKGVPISEFTGGNTYEFMIQPSVTEFQSYNMVRVQQVLVDIPAIQGSKGGSYRIDLSCEGNPFEDRSPSGEPLTFNTVTRHFGPFEYKVAGHKPVFGNETGSIGAEITRITPFSTWQVKMPQLSVNDGLDFGPNAAVDIVLTFRIEALAERRFRGLLARGAAPMLGALAEPAPVSGSTVDDMLKQMFTAQAVLKGWDCVLNMLEDPVNQFLAVQYKEKYPSAKPMTVAVGFCQAISAGPSTVLAYTRLSVDLGPPLLAFQSNNHNYVAVTQVIQSGYFQTGSKIVPAKDAKCEVPPNLDDPAIQWGDKTPIDVSKKPTVEGTVALGKVQGLVTPSNPDGTTGNKDDAHSVILDFTKGSFVARNLNIDTDDAQVNLQLSNWFVTNAIQYIINTVVFNDATTLKSLQPTKFKLNVLTTNSNKNVLQIFITTTGQQQSNLTINVNEPIPDGFHNSLMINTKIMFQDIFVHSFNKQSTNLQVESLDPGNDFTAWSAQVSSGSVSGEAKFDNTSTSENRIAASGNTVTWPLNGLKFAVTENLGISLTYNAKKTVNFQHRSYTCVSSQYSSYCSWSSWSDYSVVVDVTLTGNYPITVNNVDGVQEVQIASAPPSVTVTPPDLTPTGPCECNDNDLKILVGNILKKQVPAKLQDSMAGIKFTPVSVFALYNLLFPTNDFIVMQQAYVPGDLVVLGTFNKYVSES